MLRCMSLLMARMRHSKIADELPLSGEERSCSGHHRHDRVRPEDELELGRLLDCELGDDLRAITF
jgi:hypothetical protein